MAWHGEGILARAIAPISTKEEPSKGRITRTITGCIGPTWTAFVLVSQREAEKDSIIPRGSPDLLWTVHTIVASRKYPFPLDVGLSVSCELPFPFRPAWLFGNVNSICSQEKEKKER